MKVLRKTHILVIDIHCCILCTLTGFSDGQDGVDSGSVEGAESSLPGDVATAIADGAAVNGGVKKVKIAGLYKPPTHDELQSLKETQHLFKSNLMRLQVLLHSQYSIRTFSNLLS